jgi:6-pyruvoyl-tetrahydropterin synthase related domain
MSHRAAPPTPSTPSSIRLDLLADIAILGIAVWWLSRLTSFASGARYMTDECFHAYMAEWIAGHGALPERIPGLYSGFAYYYPPLFHLLGAGVAALFGDAAFKFVNVLVSALLVIALYWGCRVLGARAAGRWAVALCAANLWLSVHAVRLYVEQLTALLAAGAVLLILNLRRTGQSRDAAWLGIVAGLALVAKHSSLVLVGLVILIAIAYAIRRQTGLARAYAMAAGIALLVAAPMFIRNQLLYGSPIYPALAPDLDPLLYQLNKSTFTPNPASLYFQAAHYTGWVIGLVAAAGLAFAIVRRQWTLEVGILGFCLAVYLAAPLQALLDARHLLPVIVAVALLGAILLDRALEGRRGLRLAVDAALIVAAVWCVSRLPNPRLRLDQPLEAMEVYRAVQEHVPEGEAVLSLYTYDTFYYARRDATWPIPWGQKTHPVEMFLTANCDSVLAAFRQHDLKWVLTTRGFQDVPFNGANYPGTFVNCMSELYRQKRISAAWVSNTTALIRLSARDSAAAGSP